MLRAHAATVDAVAAAAAAQKEEDSVGL